MAIVNYYQNGVKSEPIEAKELVGLIKKGVIDKTTIIEVNGQKVGAYRIKQLKPIFDSLPPQEEELEIEPETEEKAEVKAEEKADENKNPQPPKGCAIGCLCFILFVVGFFIFGAFLPDPPYDDPDTIQACATTEIKNHLKDPKSAEFPYGKCVVNKVDENHAVVTMEVISNNSFGAKVKNTILIYLYYNGHRWEEDRTKDPSIIYTD